MPVSHLGLPVSHIPSATSFYLAALQPLGYRFIDQQGDSIGLGIDDADFFLCQEQSGYRSSPTHIAFAADTRLTVRNCYAAALDAGGSPSGAPGYRNDDCSCFNAAVSDLDGNTIEFIHRKSGDTAKDHSDSHTTTANETARDTKSQSGSHRGSLHEDDRSFAARSSKAKSRYQTTMDLASATKKAMSRSDGAAVETSSSPAEANSTKIGGNAIVGTILGAAAGAAITYAMCSTERENAHEEAAYAASVRSKPTLSARTATLADQPAYPIAETVSSRRHPPPSLPRAMRAIEAPYYEDEDEELREALGRSSSAQRHASSRVSSRRPILTRSQTYNEPEYAASSEHTIPSTRRSTIMPIDPARSAAISKHSVRHSAVDDAVLKRHDSGISVHSRLSRRRSDAGRYSSTGSARAHHRGSTYKSAADVALPASTAFVYETPSPASSSPSKAPSYISAAQVPMPASKAPSYTSTAKSPVSASKSNPHVSTKSASVSPSKPATYISAAQVPMPASNAPSYISAAQIPVPRSQAASYIAAADPSISASRATSYVTATHGEIERGSRASSYASAKAAPAAIPTEDKYYDAVSEESDGLGDACTIVPDDSISCVDFSEHHRRPKSHHSSSGSKSGSKGGSRSSRHSSRRSEAADSDRTVRPAKERRSGGSGSVRSALTVPVFVNKRGEEVNTGRRSYAGRVN